MPEPDLRMVVLGAPRADKEYTSFSNARKSAAQIVAAETEKLRGEDRRIAELLRRLNRAMR